MTFNMKTLVHLSKKVNTCQNRPVSLPTTLESAACCVPRITSSLSVEEAERTAQIFKALGDPTRVRLLSLIAAGPGGEACICDLTEPVGLSQGTVSHHMKLLADAGLVTREQRGKWAYFALNADAMEAAAAALRAG
ncbi:ArsR family transcriptional regulator [Microbacterium saperdae]|jgi:ArsR family transcriptional regulator|uniref:ArsR family transcriptional regulator n=1 Tax=Microbacterium saperdae TaxID=69368 RepID=A0A543BQG7_9MICO|nr:ArsR family transcriptional regulator [Microbacterium saperdae]